MFPLGTLALSLEMNHLLPQLPAYFASSYRGCSLSLEALYRAQPELRNAAWPQSTYVWK